MAEILTLYDEEGNLIKEDDFMQQARELYKSAIETSNTNLELFKATTSSETQIDPQSVYKTFNFLDRRFYITDEIDHTMAKEVHEFISYWNGIDESGDEADPIIIFINCPGGDLDAAFSIIDSIQSSKIPVYTVNIGRAWSGAFLILLAGYKRFGTLYSSYLFHEGSCGYSQDAHKIIQYTEFYQQMLKHMRAFILQRTSISASQYDEHQKDDWWLNSSEAIGFKIIDKLYIGGNIE